MLEQAIQHLAMSGSGKIINGSKDHSLGIQIRVPPHRSHTNYTRGKSLYSGRPGGLHLNGGMDVNITSDSTKHSRASDVMH